MYKRMRRSLQHNFLREIDLSGSVTLNWISVGKIVGTETKVFQEMKIMVSEK